MLSKSAQLDRSRDRSRDLTPSPRAFLATVRLDCNYQLNFMLIIDINNDSVYICAVEGVAF